MAKRIVAFDVIGTLFAFEGLAGSIEQHFGDILRQAGVSAHYVALFWYGYGQKDYTYLSMNGAYTPIAQVFKVTLRRALLMACSGAAPLPDVPESAIDAVCSHLTILAPRPGLAECMAKLQAAGFEIWPVSNGASKSTIGLFEHARQSAQPDLAVAGLEQHVISCDTIQVAKPDPRVYGHLKGEAKVSDASASWFVAAHAWDLCAAKRAGFRTAYLTAEEHDAAATLFGAADVQADSLAELADAIIAASSSSA